MELREDNMRPLVVPSSAVYISAPNTTDKNQRMKKIILGLVILAILLVTVFLLCFFLIDTTGVSPGPGPSVPWLSVSPKHPFSVTMTLRSKSDTNSGVGGQLQLCSSGRGCYVTDRFVFKAPTVIYLNKHQSCSKFGMDKNQEMSIKVLNEDPMKVLIYRFEVALEDGASYHVLYAGSHANSTWSQSFPLKERDITNDQKTMMKINIKNIGENPSNATYFNNTRIEVNLKGDNRTGCFTNPLPWPIKEDTVNLNNLETLGPCFTYSIREAADNLLVRYLAPFTTPFTVTKIVLKSFEDQNFGWTVRLPTEQWTGAEFDDDY